MPEDIKRNCQKIDCIHYSDYNGKCYKKENDIKSAKLTTCVLTDVTNVVENFMKKHNKNCRAGFEIPEIDYDVIKSLLIEFYINLKDQEN